MDAGGTRPGPRQGDAPPHRLRQVRRAGLHLRRPGRALLRRGRGAARALAPARLRLREQGDRPLGAALHADEPQAAAAERVHPLHGALRHRRDADAGEAGLARHPQLHAASTRSSTSPAAASASRPSRRPPTSRCRRAAGSSRAAATSTAAASGSSCATRRCGTTPFQSRPTWGGPKPQADPARARPDEDVVVPLDERDPGREGPDAAARRRLRQPGAAHARDGDHAPLPRARRRRGLRRDAGARHRPRQSVRAAAVLDAAPARADRARSRRRRRPSSATSATAPSGSCSGAARRSRGASRARSSTT